MKNEVFVSGSLSATVFSVFTAILLFTIFAVAGGILVRRAGWKMLPATTAFIIIAVLRGIILIEITRAPIIFYPQSISNFFFALYEPRIFSLSVLGIIGLIWLSVTVVLVVVLGVRMFLQHRETSRITEFAPGYVKEVFQQVRDDTLHRKTGKVYVGEGISEPMMVGFFQPIVLLPASCEGLPEEELCLILRHEMAHFRFMDLWKKLALNVVCCVFWWNPAAFFLRRAATQTQELRADAFACAGADESTRMSYADALLNTLKSRVRKDKIVAAGYFNRASDRHVKQRFREILQPNQSKQKAIFAWVAVVLALAVFCGSYMVNFQTAFAPNDAGSYEKGDPAPNQFIVNIGNGMYQLYSEGTCVATLTEADLVSGEYANLPIYSAFGNANEGE